MNYLWQTLISEDSIVDGNNCRHSFNSKFGTTEYVGLYFSASWCKPCQEFKEHFQQWYKSFKLNHGESYFQVLFISSDESVESFNTNMQHVPWFALPYEHRKLKVQSIIVRCRLYYMKLYLYDVYKQMSFCVQVQLTKKYKVATIPALVILERATGKVVCSNARRELMEDPEGTNFPWSVTSVKELIDGPLLRGSQLVQAEDVLEKSVIALFFSAHWVRLCNNHD